jgi:hypothetical protein
MELVPSDKERGLQTPVWQDYESLLLGAGCMVSLQCQLWEGTRDPLSQGLRKSEMGGVPNCPHMALTQHCASTQDHQVPACWWDGSAPESRAHLPLCPELPTSSWILLSSWEVCLS